MLPSNERAARLAKAHERTVFVHLNSDGHTMRDAVTFEFTEDATKCPIIKAEPDGSWQFIGWNGPTPSPVWDTPRELFERNVGKNEAMGGKYIHFHPSC